MIKNLIHVLFVFSLSTTAFSQNLKLNQPGLFPGIWMAGRELVKAISDGVLAEEKIEAEAQKRKSGFWEFFKSKTLRGNTLAKRRKHIQELRQEILESNQQIQSAGTPSAQELEAELYRLMALGTSPEPEEESKHRSVGLTHEVSDSLTLSQPVAQGQKYKVPGMLLVPGGGPVPQGDPVPAGLRADLPDAWIPWGMSKRVFGAMQPVANASYKRAVVEPTDPEWRVVWRCFYHDKPTKWGIRRISCVHDRDQTNRFEANLVTLEKDATRFPATWNQEPRANQRAIAIERWKNATTQFSPFQTMESDGRRRTWKDTKVLPLWHGTGEDRCHSIANSGFTYFGKVALSGQAAAGSTDDGYFGSGIYFTNSARYAADIYSQGHLMVSWVSMTEPFPVVGDSNQQDMRTLRGKGAYKHYNAHYVPVVPVDNTFECPEYYPCQPGQSSVCDELVVFQRAQALPRYWVELQVEHPAMTTPSGIPAFVEDLIPHVMRVLSNPNVDADKKLRNILNQKLASLMNMAGDDDLEAEDQDLYEQLTQLLDPQGRINKPVRQLIVGASVPAPPAVAVPVTPQVQPTPVAVLAANVARTTAMTANPLARAGDWYKGPREAKQVGALEWELGRKGSEEMTFKDAQAYAASRSAEGWRLPTVWELEALYQQQSVLGVDLDTSWFWSDTAVVGYGVNLWFIYFSDGQVFFDGYDDRYRVRLVRGGTGKTI